MSGDFPIRCAVVRDLLAMGLERRAIRHELTLDTSSSGGRTDMVVLRDDLTIIEIKSAKDRLDRLDKQRGAARLAADRFIAIVAAKHWGLEWLPDRLCYRADGSIACGPEDNRMRESVASLMQRPRGQDDPDTSVRHMLRLLWAPEVEATSEKLGMKLETRYRALRWLGENARLSDVRPLVIDALLKRQPNRWEEAFWARFDAQREAA
jgi:hypothetical protein